MVETTTFIMQTIIHHNLLVLKICVVSLASSLSTLWEKETAENLRALLKVNIAKKASLAARYDIHTALLKH